MGKLLGRTEFSPKSAPSSGKLCFSVFSPEFLQVPRAVVGQKGVKSPVFRDIPPVGLRSAKTQNVKMLSNFGEKLLGRPDFSPKSAPSSGKLCFSVFDPEFFSVPRAALGQKGLENQDFPISRPWGSGRPKRKKQKSCAIWEETFGADGFPPPKESRKLPVGAKLRPKQPSWAPNGAAKFL